MWQLLKMRNGMLKTDMMINKVIRFVVETGSLTGELVTSNHSQSLLISNHSERRHRRADPCIGSSGNVVNDEY